MIPEKFLKPYDHIPTEKKIYTAWEDSGLFNPDVCIEKGFTDTQAVPFSVVLPPPNVTGTLHTGHALMLAFQDSVIRFERMRGKKTLWLPGTDHAAIATQSKVEKIIEKEGLRKNDLGREAFLERVNQFAQESHNTIVGQIRAMGSSIDWSREAFTLDEARTKAVRTAFVRMYEDGLIYRGHKVVNWDPKGQTVISDDEVVYEERQATMYTFKYSKDFPFAISTTRPETKLGDTAVAVHPDDARYKEYVGKTYDIIFAGVPLSIKVIADESVDPEFGTGALGVTPAHSHVDAEIAQRHSLPSIQVIDEFAKMMVGDESIKGKKTTEARDAVVAWLREENLIEKEEAITQNVSKAERSGGIIEPIPKMQWFINVNKPFTLKHSNIPGIASGSETTLKSIMRTTVSSKAVTVLPERFEKTYFHWIDNLRDWCISRQIWYGHRIPVWYRSTNAHGKSMDVGKENGTPSDSRGVEQYVGVETPPGNGWVQDEDTLDTWFSSGLWTFSTLGWPDDTADFRTYHPTMLLETGYDILFFWVARMILMSGYLLGDVPFRTTYLHGLVRDEKGRKMSKSLGNIVDPLDLIQKYGTDALRMAFLVAVGPGNDSNLSEEKVKAYKKFGNKIWNIARFILSNTEDAPTEEPTLTENDRARIEELNTLTKEVTEDMEAYRLYLASEKLYHYVWHTFADVILEERKSALEGTDASARASAQWTLLSLLKTSLALLHPFMPFITEEIWSDLPGHTSFLMVSQWPTHI